MRYLILAALVSSGCQSVLSPIAPSVAIGSTVSADWAPRQIDVRALVPEPEPEPQAPSPEPTTQSPAPPPVPPPAPCGAPLGSIGPFVASPTLYGPASASNAGTWELRLMANDHGGSIGAVVRRSEIKTLKCGEGGTWLITYEWQHDKLEYWWLELYLNGTKIDTSWTITNPYN